MGSPTKTPYTVSAIIHIYFVRKPMRAHITHENPCSHDSHAYNLKRMQLSPQRRVIHIHVWSFVDCHSTVVGYTSWTFLCAALWHSYNMKGTFHSPDWVNISEVMTPLVHVRRFSGYAECTKEGYPNRVTWTLSCTTACRLLFTFERVLCLLSW